MHEGDNILAYAHVQTQKNKCMSMYLNNAFASVNHAYLQLFWLRYLFMSTLRPVWDSICEGSACVCIESLYIYTYYITFCRRSWKIVWWPGAQMLKAYKNLVSKQLQRSGTLRRESLEDLQHNLPPLAPNRIWVKCRAVCLIWSANYDQTCLSSTWNFRILEVNLLSAIGKWE